MDYTTRLTIPDLELAVGPYEAASVRLLSPAQVQVQYLFEPGYPAVLTLSNGDPGEPGVLDEFDFKIISTLHPTVFVSADDSLRLVVKTGTDLYPLLTIADLAALEREVMAGRRRDADEALIDAHLDATVVRRIARRHRALIGGRV